MKRNVLVFSISLFIIGFIFTSCEKDEYLDWKYLNEAWLDEHASDSGWVVESNGVQYRILNKEGVGYRTPNEKSTVYIKYTGIYINGDTLRPTGIERNSLTGYPVGMQQILKKMRVNDEYEVRIPHDLGYGKEGGISIPSYTTLIYRVRLLGFSSYNEYE
ncbi:FKBP-type peptidyl-prolyl cis-trans isomerase [Paludibacteraceae bacterium OttesenSCG-928-F17]|nr:FKBP-type peptidyl-prolyl cis-trans isomerase [Paludibacteraceae bacterium OttesenSCG-928-F17]